VDERLAESSSGLLFQGARCNVRGVNGGRCAASREVAATMRAIGSTRWQSQCTALLGCWGALCTGACLLYVSSIWWEIRLDRQTDSCRYVVATKDGMFHLQWHGQPPAITFSQPGFYWRVCVCSGHSHLIHPNRLLPRSYSYTGRVFVSFPILALAGTMGLWPVCHIIRQRQHSCITPAEATQHQRDSGL
jgi:hypothetical protein